MANKMLIDASHPEETRVVVLRGNRVEEFDFESANKKQLRGNIYLAKVTRVEPSLQAAFVDYGGNRHGFLAFSEIHPDYYQIPVADRLALLEDEARAHAQEEDEESRGPRRSRRRRNEQRPRRRQGRDESISTEAELNGEDHESGAASPNETNGFVPEGENGAPVAHEGDQAEPQSEPYAGESHEAAPASYGAPEAPAFDVDLFASAPVAETAPVEAAPVEAVQAEPAPTEAMTEAETAAAHETDEAHGAPDTHADEDSHPEEARQVEHHDDEDDEDEDHDEEAEVVEQLGGDALEEMPMRAPRMRRQYKIQEVIKRRQVLLVQVVKEERGNKGAALTTYLSLAGRYSVLMPNTARGGGISRKITDPTDRKRLKELAQDLEVPEGMGVILRTAGASRTKQEIRRDFEYLLRMWETVRELTLKSTAPSLVYEEGSLIKRSIRDLYNKDIDEVVVAGEEGHREARDFMRLLMPSHVKNIQAWREPQPIFARYGVEAQLDAMFSNVVTLRSGGYIVINQTEALVAIDVNSGRSTKEHNIEDTALRTNLEAADEVSRQLRLRDLAGLIVVDFIDMEENRNNRSVERRLKDALKNDRARIQVGRISHFGLLEMSRQRIRTGVLEGSTVVCAHCAGSGMVRSTASVALHVLRVLEDALIKSATHNITVRARTEVALYILNQKRAHLSELEMRFGVSVTVAGDDTLTGSVYHALERGELASPPPELRRPDLVRIDSIIPEDFEDEVEEEEDEDDNETTAETEGSDAEGAEGDENGRDGDGDARRRRRRRRRRGRGDREGAILPPDAPQPTDAGLAVMAEIAGDIPGSLAEATVSDGESDESEAEAFDVEGGEANETAEERDRRRRRRSRRGGRNRRRDRFEGAGEATGGTPVDGDASIGEPDDFAPTHVAVDALVDPAAPAFAQPHVHVPVTQDPPVALDVPVAHPTPAPVEAPAALEAQAPVAPPAAAPEPVPAREAPLPEAPLDPSRPKKTGWWARAKQSFGG